MNGNILAVIIILVNNVGLHQCRRYDNFSLFRVIPLEPEHLKFLQNVDKHKYIDLIFWKKPQKLFEDVQFIVNPADKELFMERVRHFRLNAELLIPDIQHEFDNQIARKYYRQGSDTFTWDNYHTLKDINQWLTDMALKHSKILELDTIGKSVEGRDIFAVLIKKRDAKFKVIVEGGIHGNEWPAIEFVIYLINQLANSSPKKNQKLDYLSKNYLWYLVPVLNPDGFVYSHQTDRMWRKNRKVSADGVGVDLNRNFDYNFGKFGTTIDQKDDHYCGLHPESEPETKAMADFVRANDNNLKFFFAYHNYGQKIIIPFGDRIKHIDNYVEMENYARQAVWKIYKVHGTKYTVGTTYDTLGQRITGNSASWVKKTFHVRYVFSFLLRDNGTYGYSLPPKFILPTCKEALDGLVEIMTAKRRRLNMQAMFGSSAGLGGEMLILMCTIFCLWLY